MGVINAGRGHLKLRERCRAAVSLLVGAGLMLGYGLVTAPAAQAYKNNNCKQPSATVKYSNRGSSAYVSATSSALNDWNNTPTPVLFVGPGSSGTTRAYIDVGGYGSSGYDGITYTYCGTGTQTSASNSYYNAYYTDGYSANGKRQVMVHELGHALGLGHAGSSTCSGQPIMYYSSQRYFTCNHITPQSDDINGANAIY